MDQIEYDDVNVQYSANLQCLVHVQLILIVLDLNLDNWEKNQQKKEVMKETKKYSY